jgi:hypothetical protein
LKTERPNDISQGFQEPLPGTKYMIVDIGGIVQYSNWTQNNVACLYCEHETSNYMTLMTTLRSKVMAFEIQKIVH